MASLAVPNSDTSMSAGIFLLGIDDLSESISEYDILAPWSQKPTRPFYGGPDPDAHRFRGLSSDVTASIPQVTIGTIRQLTKEEEFIQRHNLKEDLALAQDLVTKVYSSQVETSLQYCKDYEDPSLEWLSVNIHFYDADDSSIDQLLEKLDELNELFEEAKKTAKTSDINFYLDIQ